MISDCRRESEQNIFATERSSVSFISLRNDEDFPIEKILDVVSQPVKACRNKSKLQLSRPNTDCILKIYTVFGVDPRLTSLR